MSLSTQQIVRLISEARGKVQGTIYLPNNSCIALWKEELLGQFSDGAWENSGPPGHWNYWHDLDVTLGAPGIKSDARPVKTGYNLAGLFEYVGDRMLKYGRMGRVTDDPKCWAEADYMPATLDKFKAEKASAGPMLGGQRAVAGVPSYGSRHLVNVPNDVAERYYEATYTKGDLSRDLAAIKQAMKTDPSTFQPGPVLAKQVVASASTGASPQGPMKDGETRRVVNVNSETNTKKFWQVTVNGKSAHIQWGRIGAAGNSQMKNFPLPQKALNFAQEALNSKLAKGYQPAVAGPSTRATVAAGPGDSGEAGSSITGSGSGKERKVYPGGRGKPPVTRVAGKLYRGPQGSKASPGSSYKTQDAGGKLKVSGDDWTQEWMPESAQPGPYETHVRCALSGRRRRLSGDLKPTFHNLMTGALSLDEEVRKQRSGERWTKNPKVEGLYEALRPYYEAVVGRPLKFKHRDIESVLRQAIRKALRESTS
jgi:predicted DNA-binding WGR domain protein